MILQRSLTLRLSCFFSFATVIVVYLLYLCISYSVEQHFIEDDKRALLTKMKLVQKVINNTKFDHQFTKILNDIERHDGFILTIRQKNKTRYTSIKVNLPEKFFISPKFQEGNLFHWHSSRYPYSVMRFIYPAKDKLSPPLTIIIGRSIKSQVRFLESFQTILKDFLLMAGIITAVLSGFVTHRGLRPLKTLTHKATLISMQDINQRMPVDNLPVEIAGLSITLNKMLDRLENAFTRLSNFSSDIAHELRTPINSLMMQTQVSLSQPRSESEYRSILASNNEEYEHLARMIADMLFLAKVENELVLHSTELVKLDDELINLTEFYDALAEESLLMFKIEGQASVIGDKHMLNRAFNNLISNAVRHGFENTIITISIFDKVDNVIIEVGNKGETIPPEHLQHLFERFYRADKSRTHVHVGLGLAITRSIAQAHGGDLQVRSQNNETVFSLTIRKT